MRSSGRTAARPRAATSCARPATRSSCASGRDWSSTPTSPGRRSSGCSAMCRRQRTPSSGRSTPGSCISSPAATRPTTPMRRGRCCSTSPSCGGTPSCANCLASTLAGCPNRCPRRASLGRRPSSAARSRSPGSPATSRRRCSARLACEPGMAKNTYGTGSFVLLNAGTQLPEPGDGLLTTIAWGIGDQVDLRAGGGGFRHRRRRPMAARRARHRRRGCRDGGHGGLARLQRRRLLRPGAHRARLAALGSLRPGHDRRPHPRHDPRPPRPRGAGGDRLRDRRRCSRPGAARGRGARASCAPTAGRSPIAG